MPERDPDELFSAFESLTSDVSRPDLRARRAPLGSWLAAGAAVVVLGAVVTLAVLKGPLGSPGSPPTSPALAIMVLPTHLFAEPFVEKSTAIAGATVVREGECVYLDFPYQRWFVIWPAGTTLDVSTEPGVIRSAAGDRLTAVGDQFSLTGRVFGPGENPIDYLVTDIPSGCETESTIVANPETEALPVGRATWRLDPAFPVDPASTELHILLTERACASGEPPVGRVLPPRIHETHEQVFVKIFVAEIGGTCPGNPEFPWTVQLQSPIGNRALIDGASDDHEPAGSTPTPGATREPSPAPTPTARPTPSAEPTPFVGSGPATWRIDPFSPPRPSDDVLHVLITERGCASGASPDGRVEPPQLTVETDRIIIAIRVRETGGPQLCPGNPEFPVTVRVGEPIGERTLVDGYSGQQQWFAAPREADRVGRLLDSRDLPERCVQIENRSGTFGVRLPEGYGMAPVDFRRLIGPNGRVVAFPGDLIALTGGQPSGNRCGGGEPFNATEVVWIDSGKIPD